MLNWIVLNRTDYLHEMDLVLNNLQSLICDKTQQTNQTERKGFDAKKSLNAVSIFLLEWNVLGLEMS